MNQIKAFFRVDASFEIGYGHIYRCLTLADALASRGVRSTFACRNLEGIPLDLIKSRGHNLELITIPDNYLKSKTHMPVFSKSAWSYDAAVSRNLINKPIEFIIVDHYEIDFQWEQELKDLSKKFIVIDDLANRKHNCNFLIDQNLGSTKEDYKTLISKDTKLFIGPKYALLRPEFKKYRDYSVNRRQDLDIQNILISFGGADKNNFVKKILITLKKIKLPKLSKIEIIVGKGNTQKESLKEICKSFPFVVNFYEDISNMAEIMAQSDLIIGAAGSSSWERCSLGIPSIIFILAENQKKVAYALEKEKCSILVKENEFFEDDLISALDYFSNTSNLKKSINTCRNICDGDGVNKIIRRML